MIFTALKHVLESVLNRFAPVDLSDSFEMALEREIMRSEMQRMGVLAAFFGFLALGYLLGGVFLQPVMKSIFGERGYLPQLLLLFVTGYELVVYLLFARLYRQQRRLPVPARWANTFVEASLPTLGVWTFALSTSPALALVSPPAWIYFLFVALSVLRLDFRLSTFTGVVGAVEYAALALWYAPSISATAGLPDWAQLISLLQRSLFLVLTGLAAGLAAHQLRRQFERSLHLLEERNRIHSVFGQYVSPAVREKLLSQGMATAGEVGRSEVREVSVLFLDIRGFTLFAEQRSPAEVMAYLNTLFEFMVEAIGRHQGIINKFLGDGFMAVFGAPLADEGHVHHALAAAQEILAHVDALNASGSIPPTRIGIGLHTGETLTGVVGAAGRKEYTLVGDTVNLAARLEELNKTFHSRLLVSDAVWRIVEAESPAAVCLGPVAIRGRQAEVLVYRLDEESEAASIS